MKKSKLLLALPLAGMLLSGCTFQEGWNKVVDFFAGIFGGSSVENPDEFDIVPKMRGGSKAQRTAICTAINDLSPCVNRAANDLFPNTDITLAEDDGDFIRVTTKQVVDEFTVELKWGVDETQATFNWIKDADEAHQVISPKYPGFKNPSTEFKWTLESATCGKAKTTATIAEYKATLTAESHPHEEVTIAQINKCTMEAQTINGHSYPSTFDMVDYTKASPYFKPNEDDETAGYHYIKVKGKVLYYAPDGNWALIGDGDQVLELYAGSGTALTPEKFPSLASDYVEVSGNLAQYCGNIQVGFITIINDCPKGNIVDPDVNNVRQITSQFIEQNFELSSPFVCQKQAIDGFSNSLGKIEGTVVANSVKDKNGKAVASASALVNNRFTFQVSLSGGKTMTVAYDYHTDKAGEVGLFNALKSKIFSTNSIKIKGTMRYAGNNENSFILDNSNPGIWNIVPMTPSDIQ